MPILDIGGRKVTVDDSFMSLSLDEQNETVDEIATSLGVGAPEPKPETFGGKAMNATAGLNEGLYGVLGAPVDLMAGAMNLGIRGFNAATGSQVGTIDEPFGGSRSIGKAMGAVAAPLDPANTVAASAGDRIARGVGQGVAGTVLPAGIAGAALRTGAVSARATPLVEALAGRSGSVGAVAADAAAGGAAGAGGAVAQEAAPEKWKPLANLAGALVGGGAGAVAATGAPALTRALAEASGNFAAPMSAAGRERLAGQRLFEAAENPRAVMNAIEEGGAPRVEGSRPTTFQQTGDMGLGALERQSQSQFPAQFQQRRADQNAARRDAIDAIQPDGAPEAVSIALRGRLKAIDQETSKSLRDAVEWERTANRSLGQGQRPEDAGDAMREVLQVRRDAAMEKENKLWATVDPDGTLALPPQDTRAIAAAIVRDMPVSARRPGSEEAAIYEVAERYGEVMSFREVAALRSRVSEAMAYERSHGSNQAWGRLSRLRGAIESDLENAVSRKVAAEERAVAAGTMREQDTLAANVQKWGADWDVRRTEAAIGGDDPGRGFFGAGSATAAVPSLSGATRPAGTGPSGSPRDPRLSQDAGRAGGGGSSVGTGSRGGAGAGVGPAGTARGTVPASPGMPLRRDGGGGLPGNLQNAGGSSSFDSSAQTGGDPGLSRLDGGMAQGRELAGVSEAVGSPPPELPAGVRVIEADGPLGPSLDGFQDRWHDAVDWLRHAQTGDARGVLSHPEIPERIDVIWGHPGTGRSDGAGLSKIVQFHPEVLEDLPQRLAQMRVVSRTGNRIRLESETTQAAVRLQHDGQEKTWLLTAFEPKEAGRRVEGTTIRPDTLRQADVSSASPTTTEYRPFDAPAKARLDVATEATRERAGTFDNRQLGPMLARSADHSPYNMESTKVASRVFTAGKGGFERIQTFRKAAGSKKGMGAIEAFAIDSLRKAAVDRETGVVNPARLESWRRAHEEALRAFPELDVRIANASDAAKAVESHVAARKAALDAEQAGALGRLMGTEDPQDVVRLVGGLFSRQDAARQLGQLRQKVGGDKDALQGLRKAVAEHVTLRMVGNTEAATSGRQLIKADQFQTFVKTNRNALRTVFDEREIRIMEAVAADLQQANRSLASVKIPNQSNTAQDQRSVLQNLMSAGMENWMTVAGGTVGAGLGGPIGAAAGGGAAALFTALRQNGINSVDELVRDALLHPERARYLMTKVPSDPERADAMLRSLARRYVKAAAAGSAVNVEPERPKGPVYLTVGRPRRPEPGTELQRVLARQ